MAQDKQNNDNFINFILEQANEKDKEKALSKIADRFIKDNPDVWKSLVNEFKAKNNSERDIRDSVSKKHRFYVQGFDPERKAKVVIQQSMEPSFLELRKEVAEQNKSTLRKAADASLKIVEKFCYAALGAVSLAIGSLGMLEGKALKFGTLGLYNSFDATSRPVKKEEAHDFSKGRIGITRKGGRVNYIEHDSSLLLGVGKSLVEKAYTTRITEKKKDTKTMAEKVKAGAEKIGSRNK